MSALFLSGNFNRIIHTRTWRQAEPDLASPENWYMFYVYALLSKLSKDLYIGYSDNLKRRFFEHNKGLVTSTKSYRPWKLVYYEAYLSKNDATKRERQLKMHRAKEDLRTQIKNSLFI